MNKQKLNGRSVKNVLVKTALCASLVCGLSACLPIFVGGTVTGALVASDRRTLGAQTEDKAIILKGDSRLPAIAGNAAHINITSFNRKVLLTGEVPDQKTKDAVGKATREIEGVVSVENELAVLGSSSITTRSSDTIITGKVKAGFIDAKDLSANAFKVVTERGVVFLLGRVTQTEGARAATVASGVGGVQKVVKLFEYITEEDLQALTPKPANNTAAPIKN